MNARLRRERDDGIVDEKTVLISDTMPLAGLMPDTHFPRTKARPNVGDFVFADEMDGMITGGKVVIIEHDEYAIQQYWPSAKYTHWQPVWILDGTLYRRKTAPAGAEPHIIHFGYDSTIAIGSIGDTAQLSSNLVKELIANELLTPGDSVSEATQSGEGQSTVSTVVTGPDNVRHSVVMHSLAHDVSSDED